MGLSYAEFSASISCLLFQIERENPIFAEARRLVSAKKKFLDDLDKKQNGKKPN